MSFDADRTLNAIAFSQHRRALAQAIEFEQTMDKIRTVLGSTELPEWVHAEIRRRRDTPPVPVEFRVPLMPGTTLVERYLDKPTLAQAAGSVLELIAAGVLPEASS